MTLCSHETSEDHMQGFSSKASDPSSTRPSWLFCPIALCSATQISPSALKRGKICFLLQNRKPFQILSFASPCSTWCPHQEFCSQLWVDSCWTCWYCSLRWGATTLNGHQLKEWHATVDQLFVKPYRAHCIASCFLLPTPHVLNKLRKKPGLARVMELHRTPETDSSHSSI